MTPEEKFDQELLWVLDELEYKKLYSKNGESIEFIVESRPIMMRATGEPTIEAQQGALFKLDAWQAVKIIVQRSYHDSYGVSLVYTLKILQPNFDEIYETSCKKRQDKLNAIKRASDFNLNDIPDPQTATKKQLIQKIEEKVLLKNGISKEIKKLKLVEMDSNGGYLYDQKRIEMGRSIYSDIFDILFMFNDQNGFLSYNDIEKELVNRDRDPISLDELRNKRINNGIANLFRFAKIGKGKFKNETKDRRKLIKIIRGKGLQFNNHVI